MIDVSAVVGIDVSKDALDVAFGLDAPVQRFENAARGHRRLASVLAKRRPARIVMEATGGYERSVLRHLSDKELPAIRVNPRQVRDFARATGILAKTDALDARVLVRFGVAVEPEHRPLPAAEVELLGRYQARRTQLIGVRTAEKNRLQQYTDAVIVRTIRKMIETLDKQIELLEEESREIIAEHAKLQRTFDIIDSVPGVGSATAAMLMGHMPELGSLSRQAAAALAGLAPFNKDSGTQRGQRHIRGGRPAVRTALYMATLSALRYNPVIREDFERMLANGKIRKVAMTACMRKLLIIINALVRDNILWGEKGVSKSSPKS